MAGTLEYITLHGKNACADVIYLRIGGRRFLVNQGGSNVIQGSFKRKRNAEESEKM